MNIFKLSTTVFINRESAIRWCITNGLLTDNKVCPLCSSSMIYDISAYSVVFDAKNVLFIEIRGKSRYLLVKAHGLKELNCPFKLSSFWCTSFVKATHIIDASTSAIQ